MTGDSDKRCSFCYYKMNFFTGRKTIYIEETATG